MSGQDVLFGDPPAEPDPLAGLTERQRFALETIGRLGPIPNDELGAWLCSRRPRGHPPDQRCDWCTTTGRQAGEALRRAGLARRRQAGWVVVGSVGDRPTGEPRPASNLEGDIPY